MQPSSSGRYRFGEFLLDVDAHTLARHGQPIALTPKAFDLLSVLARSSGRLSSKTQLLNLVWPNVEVEENNLTVTISALRKALGTTADGRQYIENVPRVGYRLAVAVEHPETGAATSHAMQAWLWVRNATGFSCDDVLPVLAELPCVLRAESLAGEVDLAILVQVATAAELSDVRELVAAFKGVDSVTTAPILRTLLARD